jgi:predicted small secreted protein
MKLIFSSLVAIFVLSSCNTMVGLGRDTRLLGENLEKTAEKSAPNSGYDSGASGAPVY